MSDNEYPLSILGDPARRIKNFPFNSIPDTGKNPKYCLESLPLVVTNQVLDVFEQKMSGSFVGEKPSHFKKESASGVLKSSQISSNAKRLARETSGKEVDVGDC